jgi:putative ABC transport system permease protein
MNTKEIFILSITALNERKVRTVLTIMMVVVGCSLIVVLNGLSAGQTNFLEQQLNNLAANVLTVTPGQRSFSSVTTTPSIVFNSVVVNKMNSLPYVDEVIPQYSANVKINSQARIQQSSLLAMNPEKLYVRLPNLEMEDNSVIKQNDPSAILIGNSVAYPAGSTIPIVTIGQSVKVTYSYVDEQGEQQEDSRVFVVSGILKESGDRSIDRSVIINEITGNTLLKKSGKFDSLMVVAHTPELVEVVSQEITDLYGSSIGISSLKSRLQFRQSFTEGNNSFIMSVGVIALVVGAVGIVTTLYNSVTERIKEIGTMKAIGAKSSSILILFLVEALLIGIIGGSVGLVAGIIVGHGLSSILSPPVIGRGSGIEPVYYASDLLKVWLLSVTLSVIAGILPAWKASKLSPLVALRRE